MATNLDDILNDVPVLTKIKPEDKPGESQAAPPEAAPDKPEAEAPEVEHVTSSRTRHRSREFGAQGRDPDTGKFAPKEDKKEAEKPEAKKDEKKEEPKPEAKPEVKAEPPKQEFTEKERAFLQTAQEERRKRQALEAQIAAIQAQQAAAAAPQPQRPTFQEAPEQYLQGVLQHMEGSIVRNRVELSEAHARRTHPDYEDKVSKFKELAQLTPGLFQQALREQDPAEFVLRTVAAHENIQQAGGLQELLTKTAAEAAAKAETALRAKLKAEEEERAAKAAALPGSLSQVPSGAAPARAQWSGPTPLDSILQK